MEQPTNLRAQVSETLKQIQSTGAKPFPWTLVRDVWAFLVFLCALIVYVLTAQGSVPFWDCGEFISISTSLGVPHPPGAPLFAIWGRLFSLLPLGVEVARKINWMSSFFNALSIGVLFLILARIIGRWFGNVKNWSEALISCGGATAGALLAAFGTTFWNNGVEAEVYGFAMFISNLAIYMAILWSERHKDPRADRYLLLIAYLLYLGVAAHMTVLIMLPPLFLFFVIADREKRKNLIFWLNWFVLFLLATEFNIFVENMMSALVIFALASTMTGTRSGRAVFITIMVVWGLVQIYLLTRGTTLPGVIWAKYGLSGQAPNYMGALFQLIIITLSIFIAATKNLVREWRMGFFSLILATSAFSIHAYAIVRSRTNPYVDENDPETISAYRDYMDRKQYGQESLWTLMFRRKGSWTSQFGTHPRMGFWGFFRKQWANPTKIPLKYTLYGWLYFIFIVIGLSYAIYRNPRWGILLLLSTLIATIGLLLYLNFSDGTRGVHTEVRERDYFYTPGYMLLGALMGLGFAALSSIIYKGKKDLMSFLKTIGPWTMFTISAGSIIVGALVRQDTKYFVGAAIICAIVGFIFSAIKKVSEEKEPASSNRKIAVVLSMLFMLTPSIPLATYFWQNDRSKNRIPFDYAYNMLMSCDTNAVIFTNGDNDTFPLWAIQVSYGIRTDVRVVNLSLLNTSWYIKQIKHNMGVPVKFSDAEIDRLMPKYIGPGEYLRVQDIMVDHIIKNANLVIDRVDTIKTEDGQVKLDTVYRLDPPVFFAVTVDPKNKLDYDPYLRMEGLVYRVATRHAKPNESVNIEKMRKNLFEVYKYDGLNDTTFYKDENARKLIQNYTTGFITLAYAYQDLKDTARVLETINKMLTVMPYDWRGNAFAASFLSWMGRERTVDSLYNVAVANTGRWEYDPDEAKLYRLYAELYYRRGKKEKTISVLEEGLKQFPDDRELFRIYLSYLFYDRKDQKLVSAIEQWLHTHPDDYEIRQFYEGIKQGMLERMRQQESQMVDTAYERMQP